MGFIKTNWAVRVTRIDNTTSREYRYTHCEASPDPRSIRPEEDVCRLAYEFRQRFEEDTTREGITYEVEIIKTEVHTSTFEGLRECKYHAAIDDPEHGCMICNDIKIDPDWEKNYPELAGKI